MATIHSSRGMLQQTQSFQLLNLNSNIFNLDIASYGKHSKRSGDFACCQHYCLATIKFPFPRQLEIRC